jgi:hypothetical protein
MLHCVIEQVVPAILKVIMPLSSGFNSKNNTFLLGLLDPDDEGIAVL